MNNANAKDLAYSEEVETNFSDEQNTDFPDTRRPAPKQNLPARLWQRFRSLVLNFPLLSAPVDDAPRKAIVKGMSYQDRAKIYEARYGPFPRPINEQHLTSYAALRRLTVELSKTGFVVLKTIVCYALWLALGYVGSTLLYLIFPEWWSRAMGRVPAFFNWSWYLLGLLPVLIYILFDGALNIFADYHVFGQRESYGTAKWQLPQALQQKTGWIFKYQPSYTPEGLFSEIACWLAAFARNLTMRNLPSNPHKHGFFPIAPFGFGTWVCYPLSSLARHLIIFGIPGSGKSASFIMSYVRSAGVLCSAVVMDIKGEIYRHCAHKFERVFRFDLENAHLSDRILLGRMLRRDYDFAQTIARSMIQYDPNRASSGNDKFFKANGMALLTALLLHLADTNPDFTPGEIFKFLEDHPVADTKENGLIPQLLASTNPHTREIIAGMPVRAAETFDGILSNMTEALQTFKSPQIIKIFSPPTEEEYKRGCRAFDPFMLRKKGTGLFIVVPEDRAALLGNVVGTVINLTSGVLRRTAHNDECEKYLPSHALRVMSPGEVKNFAENFRKKLQRENSSLSQADFAAKFTPEKFSDLMSKAIKDNYLEKTGLSEAAEDPAYCCFIIDEAANVQLVGLREDTGVGRGRKLPYLLVYHNTDQLEVQFGRDYARTITGTIGTRIFLPGLEGETARYASSLLRRTTTFSRTVTDAKKDDFDSARTQEIGRELMTEDELRTLAEYHQAVMVALTFDPMRIAFPRQQVLVDKKVAKLPVYSQPIAPDALSGQSALNISEFTANANLIEKQKNYVSLDKEQIKPPFPSSSLPSEVSKAKINLLPPTSKKETALPTSVVEQANLFELVLSDAEKSENQGEIVEAGETVNKLPFLTTKRVAEADSRLTTDESSEEESDDEENPRGKAKKRLLKRGENAPRGMRM